MMAAGTPEVIPATYNELLRGAGAASGLGHADYAQRLAQLEQNFASVESSFGSPVPSPTAQMYSMPSSPSHASVGIITPAHEELLAAHSQLLRSHAELVQAHAVVTANASVAAASVAGQRDLVSDLQSSASTNPTRGLGPPRQKTVASGRIGIVRFDGPIYESLGDDNAAPGEDEDMTGTPGFGNKVFYQRVEGYTCEAGQKGSWDVQSQQLVLEDSVVRIKGKPPDASHLFVPCRRGGPWNVPRPRRPTRTEPWLGEDGQEVGVQYIYDGSTVGKHLVDAIMLLHDECKVDCICGASGFMSDLQTVCEATLPVPFASSFLSLPFAHCMTPRDSHILVLTTSSTLFSQKYDEFIKPHWNIPKDGRILVVGLQDVDGFQDSIAGCTVDAAEVAESIVDEVKKAIQEVHPKAVKAILSECTEVPLYTNILRERFDCPVYDAITTCSMVFSASVARDGYDWNPSHG